MVKAITGIYHHGQVQLNELPPDQSEPASVLAIFLEPGESLPPELTQFLISKTSSLMTTNPKPLPDLQMRLAKLQDFIATRAQQQSSPEGTAFFERFRSDFDSEREPERKLFNRH